MILVLSSPGSIHFLHFCCDTKARKFKLLQMKKNSSCTCYRRFSMVTIVLYPGRGLEIYREPNNPNGLIMFPSCIGVCVHHFRLPVLKNLNSFGRKIHGIKV